MSENRISIYERLHAIQSDIKQLEKEGSAGWGKSSFNFFGEAQIKAHMRALYSKHGVFAVPSFDQVTTETVKAPRKDGSVVEEMFQTIAGHIMFYSVDGESLGPFGIVGSGQDAREKGVLGAETVAVRHFIMNTFNISDGMDVENNLGEEAQAVSAAPARPVNMMELPEREYNQMTFLQGHKAFRNLTTANDSTLGEWIDGYQYAWTVKTVHKLVLRFIEAGLDDGEVKIADR